MITDIKDGRKLIRGLEDKFDLNLVSYRVKNVGDPLWSKDFDPNKILSKIRLGLLGRKTPYHYTMYCSYTEEYSDIYLSVTLPNEKNDKDKHVFFEDDQLQNTNVTFVELIAMFDKLLTNAANAMLPKVINSIDEALSDFDDIDFRNL